MKEPAIGWISVGLIAALVVGVALILADGFGYFNEQREPGDGQPAPLRKSPRYWIDADTGCHYLVIPGHAITPRLTGEGKQLCTK